MKFIVPTRYAPTSTKAVPARPVAACFGEDPELFFPVGESGPALLQEEEAKGICRRCPLMDSCLQGALDRNETTGVWGGTSPRDRRNIRRRAVASQKKTA
ncbi:MULTISPECIES: WhiB family transcriptional regulator [unclassified Streptomyces]|uniref:WhiB family transcriptional regulator n=1 Tax=unclassified Streptomyces TaxID=2593676 RepID=UPI0035DB4845